MTDTKENIRINRLIAQHIMGWEQISDVIFYDPDAVTSRFWTIDGYGVSLKDIPDDVEVRPYRYGEMNVFEPARYIDDAIRMEDRIEELGLIDEYVEALCEVIAYDKVWIYPGTIEVDRYDRRGHGRMDAHKFIWLIAHATPKERCEAALKLLP